MDKTMFAHTTYGAYSIYIDMCIYVYIFICIHKYIYIYTCVFRFCSRLCKLNGKAKCGNAMGFILGAKRCAVCTSIDLLLGLCSSISHADCPCFCSSLTTMLGLRSLWIVRSRSIQRDGLWNISHLRAPLQEVRQLQSWNCWRRVGAVLVADWNRLILNRELLRDICL